MVSSIALTDRTKKTARVKPCPSIFVRRLITTRSLDVRTVPSQFPSAKNQLRCFRFGQLSLPLATISLRADGDDTTVGRGAGLVDNFSGVPTMWVGVA